MGWSCLKSCAARSTATSTARPTATGTGLGPRGCCRSSGCSRRIRSTPTPLTNGGDHSSSTLSTVAEPALGLLLIYSFVVQQQVSGMVRQASRDAGEAGEVAVRLPPVSRGQPAEHGPKEEAGAGAAAEARQRRADAVHLRLARHRPDRAAAGPGRPSEPHQVQRQVLAPL